MVADAFGQEKQCCEADHRERDHAMEASGLGMGPRVKRTDDLASPVRVGAATLHDARVAGRGASSVPNEALLLVELVRPELLALWAQPVVVIALVGKPCSAKAQGAPVRVRRKPL